MRAKAKEGDKRLGNSFWEKRSKHGRDRIFATPETLWEASCEYFKFCEENPFKKAEAKTVNIGDYMSEIQIANVPVMRPFTIHGLCLFLDVNTVWFNQFEKSLVDKDDKLSKDFSQICTRIREIIYDQKFSGAASGLFNANLISRDLGLQESVKNEFVGEISSTLKVEYTDD